jgi:uncharacterized membrane protein YcaP (DUF421 family)
VRTVVGTLASYVVLVALLRVAGQRTLAKWYAFDLIVTMALGSAFASGILSKDVTIAQSAAGFVTLVVLQFIVARTVVAVNRFRKVVNSSPALVFYNGEFRRGEMKKYRVADPDIRAAVRGHGHGCLEEIDAVVLEPDGTFSVIKDLGRSPTAMMDLDAFADGVLGGGKPERPEQDKSGQGQGGQLA